MRINVPSPVEGRGLRDLANAENGMIFGGGSPWPEMPSVTTSPTLRNFGSGLMPSATPGGVPVTMMSPGSMMKNCEQYQTRCSTPKIIVLVLPC